MHTGHVSDPGLVHTKNVAHKNQVFTAPENCRVKNRHTIATFLETTDEVLRDGFTVPRLPQTRRGKVKTKPVTE